MPRDQRLRQSSGCVPVEGPGSLPSADVRERLQRERARSGHGPKGHSLGLGGELRSTARRRAVAPRRHRGPAPRGCGTLRRSGLRNGGGGRPGCGSGPGCRRLRQRWRYLSDGAAFEPRRIGLERRGCFARRSAACRQQQRPEHEARPPSGAERSWKARRVASRSHERRLSRPTARGQGQFDLPCRPPTFKQTALDWSTGWRSGGDG